jgi:hypothetical protein
MTISEEDKKHIREEEIYRNEIRKNLEKPKNKSEKMLNFLNSAFGIFLLSSIFLTGLTSGYSYIKDKIDIERIKQTKINHIDLELSYRTSVLQWILDDKFDYHELHTVRGALIGSSERIRDYGKVGYFAPVFLEFKDRSMVGLMLELEDLENMNNSKVALARQAASQLTRWFTMKNLHMINKRSR